MVTSYLLVCGAYSVVVLGASSWLYKKKKK